MRIKKDDLVQVISGDDKGKRGKVLRVLPKDNKVIVEGINYIYRHLKKSQKNTQGGRVQKEAPIHVSNVMLYCTYSQKPTRTTYRYEEVKEKDQDKEVAKVKRVKKRYSKKSNRVI